jgi:hypothetical protein
MLVGCNVPGFDALGIALGMLACGTLLRCGAEDDPPCDALARQAYDTREAAAQNASLTCSRDEDCVIRS